MRRSVLAKLQGDRVSGQQAMEEGAADFLVGVFVMARGIVEGAQEFFTASLVRYLSAYQLFDEGAYCFIIGDRELVRMTGHGRSPFLFK